MFGWHNDERPNIFWRHQPDLVTMLGKQPAEMMCAAACLHRDHASSGENLTLEYHRRAGI
jgi:hypothetical protein